MASRASVVSSYTVKQPLVEETYLVFQRWDPLKSRKENLDALRRTNFLGKRSSSWLNDVSKVLNRRFDPSGRDAPLAALATAGIDREIWKPILLFHMTRDEFLIRDFLSGWLFQQHEEGTWRLRVADVLPFLEALHHRPDVRIKEQWSEATTKRVASGLLRFAVDFGLMSGTIVREFIPYHLPEEAFLYVLHALAEQEPNARRLVEARDWRMFLMSPSDVEQEIFRLHQFQRLHYEVAGSVAELRLPHATAADYARWGFGGALSPEGAEMVR